ncbi:MAG: hypothetical protein ACD_60C00010G0007 [uncultured bacterium]|nr:MAG: hypothetical protein ACD_60C00010G0007 [uncultured bacterium]
MKILCTICARGGSLGVKNKNIRILRGKPLIAHSILQAKKSNLFDLIVVSSDSKKIHQTAIAWGADYVIDRPKKLATAIAPKLPVIQHAMIQAEKHCGSLFDIIIDLDATSPLRTIEDIVESFNLFTEQPNANNLVTATPARRSPYFNMLEMNAEGFAKLVKKETRAIHRRQDAPSCYDMNASIYIWKRETLLNGEHTINDRTLLYIMPEERSIDIDSHLDWKFVSLLARGRKDLA